jgi:hypothetical protein
MEVRIKHIRSQEWSGIHKYPNCTDLFRPYLTRSGRLHTGISPEDAERLGELLGEDLRPSSKFWKTFSIRLGTSDVVLHTEDPFEELKYLFLKNHKRISNSIEEIFPGTLYYISVKEEEAKEANKRSRSRRKAYKEFDKLTPEEMRKALRIYGYKSDGMSDEVVEQRLMTLLETNPDKFFEKWVDNKNRATEFLVKDAISKNVIRKNRNIYSYGTTVLGNTLELAILFLDNKENSDIKAAIINESEVK